MPRTDKRMPRPSTALRTTALVALAVFILLPIYYMVITSLKTQNEVFNHASLLVREPVVGNYSAIFTNGVARGLLNSLVVAGASTLIALFLSIGGAYSIARIKLRLNGSFRGVLLASYLVPSTILFIPFTVLMGKMSLIDTTLGLIVVYLSITTPMGTWLLIGFFEALPAELEEAALIDGASRLRALWQIMVPVISPGIASVGIIMFTTVWNEYLYALVLTMSPRTFTFPITISALISGDVYQWGQIMAGSLVGSLPIVILYYISQRMVVEGLAGSAVKG